ncbi:MAG: hypothetical protein ACI92I_000008 [Acidimicrobiales bacterium]|jgi:hypothetical protein
MDFKEKFPTEESVQSTIGENWGDFTNEVYKEVGHLEQKYKRIKKRQGAGMGMVFIGGALIVTLLETTDVVWSSVFGEGLAIFLGIVILPVSLGLIGRGIYLLRDGEGVVKRFNTQLNALIFSKVFSTFGLDGTQATKTFEDSSEKGGAFWVKDINSFTGVQKVTKSTEDNQVSDLLNHSELVTEPHNRVMSDDMMNLTIDGKALFVAELELKHVTGSGKHKSVKKIFKGYFCSLDLTKTLKGKTFISTEGDKKGFGHRTFFSGLRDTGAVETILEWNDFENLLHVATTDEAEARYVLSTDFMSDLYDWWKDKKKNIRISFIGNRMYLLFPDKKIRFFNSVPSLNTASLQEYTLTIALPLMHVLHLAEDVQD